MQTTTHRTSVSPASLAAAALQAPTKKTVGTQLTAAHAELISRAAVKAGKSVNRYVREVLVPWACSDIGEQAPDLSVYDGVDAAIAAAATRVGMTQKAFMARAAHEAAIALLKVANAAPRNGQRS